MARTRNPKLTKKILEAYDRLGSVSAVAKELGVQRLTVRGHLRSKDVDTERPRYAGRTRATEAEVLRPPKRGKVATYIFTSAQNNTHINTPVWENVQALAAHYGARLMVSTFSYDKASYGRKSTKRGKGPTVEDTADLWYAPEVLPYVCDKRVQVAPDLIWCGEMNILPTAVNPLSGLEVYTGTRSGIFGHVKLAMASVANGKHERTKFNFTTGTVTKRNYIQKKAGLKAEFHHVYGGLLVEVDDAGDWWARQLSADPDGTLYDLGVRVEGGVVEEGHDVFAVNWGDIHNATLEQENAQLCWGPGGMLEALRPKYQFFHDTMDFRARNGHVFKRDLTHERFATWVKGHDSVEQEMADVATLIDQTSRPWCTTVCVNSNHDNFVLEWLAIQDYRKDPVNAVFFLEAQLHAYRSIAKDPDKRPNMLRWGVERANGPQDNVVFLDEDESFVRLGLEFGMHGHLGPNGAKGSPLSLARSGRRANVGHYHSACIYEGVYAAGMVGAPEQGYNRGPSSWSPTNIVTYPNGKRTMVTFRAGKWRAARS